MISGSPTYADSATRSSRLLISTNQPSCRSKVASFTGGIDVSRSLLVVILNFISTQVALLVYIDLIVPIFFLCVLLILHKRSAILMHSRCLRSTANPRAYHTESSPTFPSSRTMCKQHPDIPSRVEYRRRTRGKTSGTVGSVVPVTLTDLPTLLF